MRFLNREQEKLVRHLNLTPGMKLIQILLPLYDNNHAPLPQRLFDEIRAELVERFGGITTFVRSPATGLWRPAPHHAVADEIVIYEVMVKRVDRRWWRTYRERLRILFGQQSLIVRASAIELL